VREFYLALWLASAVLHGAGTSGQVAEQVGHALEREQPQQAIQLADDILKREPNNAQVWTLRGLALARVQQEKQGLASLTRALDIAPNYLPALRGSAQIAYALRDPSAPLLLARLVHINPRDEVAHAMLGSLASEAGKCRQALDELRAAPSILRSNADTLLQFGNCQLAIGQPGEAVETFRKLVALEPENPTARYKLALALGDTDEALALLRNLPPKSPVLRLIAGYYAKRKDPQASVAALRQAIGLDPSEEENYLDLGSLYIEQRQPQQAVELINQALQHVEPSARLLTTRGAAFTWLNESQQAARDFAQADELAPEQLYGAVGLSMLLRRNQDLPHAIELLGIKLAQRSDDPILNYLLADTLIRTGAQPGQPAFSQAVSLLRKTLALDPKFQKAHVSLGKLYLRSSRTNEAIDQFEEALRLDSDDRSALTQLIIVLRRDGRNREAAAISARLRALVLADEQLPALQ
jgi:tetratricopeptide (TPR) repeat protein